MKKKPTIKKLLPKYDDGGTWGNTYEQPINVGTNNNPYSNEEGNTYNMYNSYNTPIQEQPVQQTGYNPANSMGWFAYANQAKDMGKSMIEKDQYGNPKGGNNQAFNEILTPDHEQMMTSIKNKQYGQALLNSTGLGKFGRMASQITGNTDNTSGGWGKFNKLVGTPNYNIEGINTNQYPMGGINQMPNAEVEKQEVLRMPNGEVGQVNGPSHEQGGVPVNIPNGTQIFSDRLKDPLTKKTFAKLAEKYKTSKEDKVLSNDKTTTQAKATAQLISETKQRKLSEIFNTQEALKQAKVAKYAEKMGISLPQQEFKMGGTIPRYDNGGYKLNRGTKEGDTMDLYNQEVRDMYSQYGNTPQDVTSPDYNPNFNNTNTPTTVPPSTYNTGAIPYENIAGNAASFIGQNAGNIYDLYKSNMGKNYDRVNYGSVNPTLLSDKQALIDADINSAVARGQISSAVNGNAGAYLNYATQTASNNTLNKARIRQQYQNANAGITNQSKYYNKDLQTKATIDEAMNKARAEDMTSHAIRDIGSKSASSYKDYKSTEMDNNTLSWISKSNPDYTFDKKQGWLFKGRPIK